jgi:hypothetical protein
MSEADLRQIVNQPDCEEFYALLRRMQMYRANIIGSKSMQGSHRVGELDGIL